MPDVGAGVVELIGQVENGIGLEELKFLPEQIEVVENREMILFVTELVQCCEHVSFGFAILGFEVLGQIGIDPRRRQRIEQREDFELLLHGGRLRSAKPSV